MTQEERKTLEDLYSRHAILSDAQSHRIATALRAALVERTCSTCRWLRHAGAHFEDTEPVCGHESEAHPLHWCQPVGNADTFGCTFWGARR